MIVQDHMSSNVGGSEIMKLGHFIHVSPLSHSVKYSWIEYISSLNDLSLVMEVTTGALNDVSGRLRLGKNQGGYAGTSMSLRRPEIYFHIFPWKPILYPYVTGHSV